MNRRLFLFMKKTLIYLGLSLVLTGCTLESIDIGKNKEQEQQQNVETQPVFEARTVSTSYINIEAQRLNVRRDADVESSQIGAVYENDKFQVIEEKEDTQKRIWYRIEFEPGKEGYIAGWFCAKTEITIRVEEDTTDIVDIKVYPIPQYIDNPFDPKKVNVGDQIGGMNIKEKSQIDQLNKIVFDGEVELTGSYYHEKSRISSGTVVRFVPDEASSVLLPRMTNDIDDVWFILSDYNQVANKFGDVGSKGYATLKIKDYTIAYGVDEAYNQAKLVSATIE